VQIKLKSQDFFFRNFSDVQEDSHQQTNEYILVTQIFAPYSKYS